LSVPPQLSKAKREKSITKVAFIKNKKWKYDVFKFPSFQSKIPLILMKLLRKYNEKIDVKLPKKQTALNHCDTIERSLGEK
jgi:hypothetical protein